jgi:hypothetical protein
MTNSYRGGLRIGRGKYLSMNYTYPFAKMTFGEEFLTLEINLLFIRYSIPYAQISSVHKENGIFSKGVRIEHSCTEIPPFIIFWCWKNDEVLSSFQTMGIKKE